ncbi:MAG TPA: 50S ribosomal protein L6 [Cryomorphaceae bacterium]|nr:50S ribosomal protein L6 [Owenweeksia sp.]MBF99560.1 50S ribosomal protein L6 [Owenweeksia sp.]HAD98801.1 50S ribosomal protein L6 [Cryomorphaceae bacterium]HBF19363.1 50S ribosomal protein L6 [Cryomorphaceae bacterium]|tara:strand:+ start:244 stop:795 length:552 start_codon:yes stop_codon:yes gene_type:complete
MSRVGKAPISIPEGVDVKVDNHRVTVKGKLGELSQEISSDLNLKIEDGVATLERSSEAKQTRANHGLYRALLANMMEGVSKGFEKKLELVGVGYRASHQGQRLDLSLGYSHNIVFELPNEVKVETLSEKGKNPLVTLSSHDKQLLGLVASKIRSFRKPEPYKGKGVRFQGEYIRRKAGKTAGK